jgi:hypothetical protein
MANNSTYLQLFEVSCVISSVHLGHLPTHHWHAVYFDAPLTDKLQQHMQTSGPHSKVFVLHNSSGISAAIAGIMCCGETNYPHTEVAGMPAIFRPDLVLQECQVWGDRFVLICRDLRKEDKLKGAPVVVVTAQGLENNTQNIFGTTTLSKSGDMSRSMSAINNMLTVFGFAYLVMNNPAK